MRSKKEYVIGYTGLFESGYVIITFTGKHNSIRKYSNPHDLKKDANRFRFKFMARLFCWLSNKNSQRNCDLRTFEVITIYP